MAKSMEEVAEAMFTMVSRDAGSKKYKPSDLSKAMINQFGGEVDKQLCKDAIRHLVDNGRLVYTYFGGSYLEVPHKEGAAPD
jgi:transposase-like protein